ncbi:unknown similar to AMEV086 [Adoxophyes honmai entomopoxvirus 'L']|uniref:Uncharacterized protein n=1 Tax=Adoxophyes honmai entomopoxvirus 'L' TaxID=1293540 RepID=A0A916KPG2_9POXV|nr:unknown similar to AMEV086 [Adoxophyes honmai entomopoxvirus 'L']CCU55405.1 unknown similar to AMEV086 [Adoxophyes honmai entomopoxvirus 'L']
MDSNIYKASSSKVNSNVTNKIEHDSLILSIGLQKKDLKIKYVNLYNEVLLRQKNDANIINALKPNSNFFEKYSITERTKQETGIMDKPFIIKSHLKDK